MHISARKKSVLDKWGELPVTYLRNREFWICFSRNFLLFKTSWGAGIAIWCGWSTPPKLKKDVCALGGGAVSCPISLPLNRIYTQPSNVYHICTLWLIDVRVSLTTLQWEDGLNRRCSWCSTPSRSLSHTSTFQARNLAVQIYFVTGLHHVYVYHMHLLPPVGLRQGNTLQSSGGKTYTFIEKLGSGRFWSLGNLLVSCLVSIGFSACLVTCLFDSSIRWINWFKIVVGWLVGWFG